MSRLSTRTKIAVGVGLVVCALAWLVLRPGPPPITARFVRYNHPADPRLSDATIEVSNRTSAAIVLLGGIDAGLVPFDSDILRLGPHESRCFGYGFGPVIHTPQSIEVSGASYFRLRLVVLLSKLGIGGILRSRDFTVSIDLPPHVDLPPIETNVPAQPVTP